MSDTVGSLPKSSSRDQKRRKKKSKKYGSLSKQRVSVIMEHIRQRAAAPNIAGEEAPMAMYWAPNRATGYMLVKSRDRRHFFDSQGTPVEVKSADVMAITDFKALETGVNHDLVSMQDLSDPSIIYTLEKRLKDGLIYTFVGDIIIAMNPFKRLPIYTEDIIHQYHGRAMLFAENDGDAPAPHVFYSADESLYHLFTDHKAQSIIISGESGAGKTETAKQVLHFFGSVCGGGSVGTVSFENLILQASPILEAFGNAATVRNHNSSRFGKYCNVFFDTDKKICGCSNISYLLEKSRVVNQDPGERNFHAFYQLIKGTTSRLGRLRRTFQLSDDCTQFLFLNQSGVIDLDAKNDVEDYEETEQASRDLGLDDTILWQVPAAILHVGNMKFYNRNGELATDDNDIVHCDLKQCESTRIVAELLGLDEVAFNTGFC